MSSNESAKKKRKNNGTDRDNQVNGVLITVYVESTKPRSGKLSNPMTKIKAHQRYIRKKSAGKQGYDRRAQLLAYSRQLRNASSEEGEDEVRLSTNQRKRKTNSKLIGIWLTQPARICSPSSQTLRQSHTFKESKQVNHRSREKGAVRDKFSCLSKVKKMLRQMSCKEI